MQKVDVIRKTAEFGMSNKELNQTQATENEIDAADRPDNGDESTQSANTQRRRALLAGLAAAPVILTLMNRSAWGADCSNMTVASFQQGGNTTITASFQTRHRDARINPGNGKLQC